MKMQFAEPAYLCSNKSKKEMKRIAFTVWLTVVSMMAMATHLPDVEGTVVDEQGQPLEFVNVVLLSEGDSAFVQGATTDATGHFLIKTPENHGDRKSVV